MQNPKPLLDKINKNRVTVRIWKTATFVNKLTGHVSLDMCGDEDFYVSLYPNSNVTIFQSKAPAVYRSLRQDLEIQRPDVIIHLYSLDIVKMKSAFKNLRESNFNWDLWSSTYFKEKNTENRNCSSVVLELLLIGGIDKLVYVYAHNPREMAQIGGAFTGAVLGAAGLISIATGPVGIAAYGAVFVYGMACGAAGALTANKVCDHVGLLKTPYENGRAVPLPFTNLIITPNHICVICETAVLAEQEKYKYIVIDEKENTQNEGASSRYQCKIM